MNLLDMNVLLDMNLLLDEGTSGRLCLTLLHSLWQVAFLVAIVWVIDRLGRKSSVERGYTLHVGALLAALVALPVTYALLPAPVTPTVEVAPPVFEPELPMPNPGPVADIPLPELSEPALPIEPAMVAIEAEPVVAITEPEPAGSRWMAAAPWIVAFYAVGVAVMLLRLAVGSVRAHAVCRRARKIVDGPLASLLARLTREWSLRVRCRLAESTEVVVPQVIGLVRPTILLPAAAITGLAPRDLEMILVHELAHIRRHDVWVNFLQRLAEAVLFFNPGLWYLSRRIGTLREYCCDELACRDLPGDTLPPRVEYATALLNVVELAKPGARTPELGALAASGRGPSELRRRVARLFGEPLREPLRLSRGGVLAAVGMAVVLVVGPAWWVTSAQEPDKDTAAEVSDEELVTMRGRVIDEKGRPVPGAKVAVVRARGRMFPIHSGATYFQQERLNEVEVDGNGEFEVEVPRASAEGSSSTYREPRLKWQAADLVAIAPGYAHDWVSTTELGDSGEVELILKSQSTTIKGRIVDTDGQPVEGASLSLVLLARAPEEAVAKWAKDLEDFRAGKKAPPDGGGGADAEFQLEAYAEGPNSQPAGESWSPYFPVHDTLLGAAVGIPVRVLTDAEGRFEMSGLSPNQLVELQLDGEGLQQERFHVVTRPLERMRTPAGYCYGLEFEHAAQPGRAVRGTVKDAETGEPLAGFVVTTLREAEIHGSWGPLAETTDAEGRFFVDGLSMRDHLLTVFPAAGRPYLVSREIWIPELRRRTTEFEISLRKGVLVTGKLTDAETGEPVEATIHVHPLRDNPHAADYSLSTTSRNWLAEFDGTNKTAPDGSFTVVAIPGENILGAYPMERDSYCVGLGAEEISHPLLPNNQYPTFGYCSPHLYARLVTLEIPEGSEPIENDLTISRGATVEIRPVDSDGMLVEGVEILRGASLASTQTMAPGDQTLAVVAISPTETRTVRLRQDERGLGKLVHVSASDEDKSPLNVTLQPYGRVLARLVDDAGEPISGLEIRARYLGDALPLLIDRDGTDDHGRVELKHLPPNEPYIIWGWDKKHGNIRLAERLEVGPGEQVDLGTIDVTKSERPDPVRVDVELDDSREEAITIIADKFVVAPVTTPLERNLMGNIGRAADVTTALLVNNNQFAADGAIDPQGEAWQELTERLQAAGAEGEDGLYVRLIDTQRDNVTFQQRQARHTALEKVIEKHGKEAGFARVHTSHHYGSGRRNWHNTIEEAQRKVKEDFADGLPLVDTEQMKVTLVSTFLAHMLVDADCVVDWLPVVRDADGARLMADVLPAVAEAVEKAETGGGETLLIRLRFSETAEQELENWANDIPGRKAYASELGFELCNVSQSQIAKEEEEKLLAAGDNESELPEAHAAKEGSESSRESAENKGTTKPASNAGPEEIAALEELVKSYEEIHENFKSLYEAQAMGGTADKLHSSHLALLMAKGELETAKRNFTAAVDHHKAAVKAADENVTAHQQAYEAGTITLDAVLEANRKRAEAKVALSRAQKRLPNKGTAAEAPSVPILCIAGINLGAESKPVAGAEVHLFQRGESGEYQHFGPYVTDSAGRADCPQAVFYEGDKYDRWFYARLPGKLVGVARSMHWGDQDFLNPHGVIDMRASQTLTGRLTVPEGFDPTKVRVRSEPMGLFSGVGIGEALPEIFHCQPDKEGKFEFNDIPGRLYLLAEAEGLGQAQWKNDTRFDKPMFLRLEKESRLAGRVLTPDGEPASGMKVIARISRVERDAAELTSFVATTDDEGRFMLDRLPERALVITVEDPSEKWAMYPIETLAIRAGTTHEQDLQLSKGVTTVCQAVDEEGNPQANTALSLCAMGRSMPELARASTDSEGTARFHLAPGTYRVFADGGDPTGVPLEVDAGGGSILFEFKVRPPRQQPAPRQPLPLPLPDSYRSLGWNGTDEKVTSGFQQLG